MFTAHSLPQRILDAGDPYPDQLRADRRGRRRPARAARRVAWSTGWQSAGRTPEPWLGPDMLEIVDALAADRRRRRAARLRRAASSPTTSRCCTTSTSRPRRRAAGTAWPSPARHVVNDDATVMGALAERSTSPVAVTRGRVSSSAAGSPGSPPPTSWPACCPTASRSCCARPTTASAARSAPRRSPGCPRSTRAPTRSSPGSPTPPRSPARSASATELTSPTDAHGGGLVRRPAPDPRRPRARRARRHAAPRPQRPAHVARQGARRAGTAAAPTATPTTRSVSSCAHRFGDEVHERLVDALVGSIYAADTDRFSLAMVPQLADPRRTRPQPAARRPGRARRAPAADGPVFYAPLGGDGVARRRGRRRRRRRGATLDDRARRSRSSQPTAPAGGSTTTVRRRGRWPPRPRRRAPLLADAAPEACAACSARSTTPASILVTLAVPRDWPERLRGRSGYLVPKPVQRRVTAVSFGSQKWAHWRGGDGRGAAGVARARRPPGRRSRRRRRGRPRRRARSARHSASTCNRRPTRVSRWPRRSRSTARITSDGSPRVDAALPGASTLAGASYDGIGIPACIDQAAAHGGRRSPSSWPRATQP